MVGWLAQGVLRMLRLGSGSAQAPGLGMLRLCSGYAQAIQALLRPCSGLITLGSG
jgi:hypothetical protein